MQRSTILLCVAAVVSLSDETLAQGDASCSAASVVCPIRGGCDRPGSGFGIRDGSDPNVPANHPAQDFPGAQGTGILAAATGEVERSYSSVTYGETIILKHGDGSSTLYAHLRERFAFAGDGPVTQGDLIGSMNNTGIYSQGNHLHFEYAPFGQIIKSSARIDPLPCIVPFRDEFDSYRISGFPSPGPWEFVDNSFGAGQFNQVLSTEQAVSGTRSMKLESAPDLNASIFAEYLRSDITTLEASIFPTRDDSKNASLALLTDSGDIAGVTFYPDGRIAPTDTTTDTIEPVTINTVAPYSANEWTRVKLELDNRLNLYSIVVNGSRVASNLLPQPANNPFTSIPNNSLVISSLNNALLGGGSGAGGTVVYFDDVTSNSVVINEQPNHLLNPSGCDAVNPTACDNAGGAWVFGQTFAAETPTVRGVRFYIGYNSNPLDSRSGLADVAFLNLYQVNSDNTVTLLKSEQVQNAGELSEGLSTFSFSTAVPVSVGNTYFIALKADDRYGMGLTDPSSLSTYPLGSQAFIRTDGTFLIHPSNRDVSFAILN